MRGLAVGSARAQPHLAARLGRDERRRDQDAVALVGLGAVVFEVGARHVKLDVGRRQAAARARERDHLGDRRGERAALRSSHSASALGPFCAVERAVGQRPPRSSPRTGWSCRLRPTPGRSWRTCTPAAASSSAAPMPDSSSSWGELIAPADSSTSRSRAHELLAAAARAQAHADGPVALELDAEHRDLRAHLEVGARERGAQEGIGCAEAPAVALGDLEHRRAVLLGTVAVLDGRDAGGLAGGQQAPVERSRRALLADAQRPADAVVVRGAAHVVLGRE